MISSIAKKWHTKRIIKNSKPESLKILLLLARKHGYWHHIDWDQVEAHILRFKTPSVARVERTEPQMITDD